MSSPIPSLYRIWFTLLDPLLTLTGIYLTFFTPYFVLAGFNPTYQIPPSSETILLLDHSGAWFIAILILQLGLLRSRPDDVLVWWYYALAVGVVDTLTCAAVLRTLETQGRLGVGGWRWEEWVNLASTGACALVRGAFVLGIGIGDGTGKAKKV